MFHDDDVSNERGKPFVYDVAFSYDAKKLLVCLLYTSPSPRDRG